MSAKINTKFLTVRSMSNKHPFILITLASALITLLVFAIISQRVWADGSHGDFEHLRCHFNSNSIDPIVYKFHDVTYTYQVAVNGAKVSWNETSAPGSFSNSQSESDPEIDIYDRNYWWNDYARMVYLCGVNGIFLGNEVDIKFNTDTMSGLSASDKAKVAMHEMGHAYGLDHANSGCVVMRKYLSQFKNCSPLPASGDVDGVDHLY